MHQLLDLVYSRKRLDLMHCGFVLACQASTLDLFESGFLTSNNPKAGAARTASNVTKAAELRVIMRFFQ